MTFGSEKQVGTVTPEAKAKISASLKQYFKEHPEAVEAMSERGKEQMTPERRNQCRQASLDLETGKRLMEWRRANPENEQKRADAHGEAMKQWYKDHPQATQAIIDKRNVTKRTPESRAKLSATIKQKIKDNPEWDKARRAKVHAMFRERASIRQQCLLLVKDKSKLPDGRAPLNDWKTFYESLVS